MFQFFEIKVKNFRKIGKVQSFLCSESKLSKIRQSPVVPVFRFVNRLSPLGILSPRSRVPTKKARNFVKVRRFDRKIQSLAKRLSPVAGTVRRELGQKGPRRVRFFRRTSKTGFSPGARGRPERQELEWVSHSPIYFRLICRAAGV